MRSRNLSFITLMSRLTRIANAEYWQNASATSVQHWAASKEVGSLRNGEISTTGTFILPVGRRYHDTLATEGSSSCEQFYEAAGTLDVLRSSILQVWLLPHTVPTLLYLISRVTMLTDEVTQFFYFPTC